MNHEAMGALQRRIERMDRRSAKGIWFGFGISAGCEAASVLLAAMASWKDMLWSMATAATVMAVVWTPLLLVMRKRRHLSVASMLISHILRGLREMEEELIADPIDRLRVNMIVLRFMLTVHGTEDAKWRNGVDPLHGHPDDRRRRLLELLTIAAWRDLGDVPYQIRLDLIAAAQIAVAAEVLQSRSISGRIRNLWLRAFARRRPAARTLHIVPVGEPEA